MHNKTEVEINGYRGFMWADDQGIHLDISIQGVDSQKLLDKLLNQQPQILKVN